MRVAERFVSINGEGMKAGEPAVFIRFQGCNLSCSYCDTKWANEPDCPREEMTPEEICAYVRETGIRNVTLTGGEPLLQEEMGRLLGLLLEEPGISVEIETNGAVPIGAFIGEKRPVFTIDCKLPTSGFADRMLTENYALLAPEDTVKFVVGSRQDMERAKEVMEEHGLNGRCSLIFSPVFGRIRPEEIVDFLLTNRMNGVKMQLQIHKIIWDPEKRGV